MSIKSLFILSLLLIITGCDGTRNCSEFAIYQGSGGSERYPIFSITNNNPDGIKGFYTKFTGINTGEFVEQIGIVAETPICIDNPSLKANIQSLEVLDLNVLDESAMDCHQQFIAGYEEGKIVFIKPSKFGMSITTQAVTDYHLVIDDFKFSKEDEWICK